MTEAELEARLIAVEARQRLYENHDPSCAYILSLANIRSDPDESGHEGESVLEACDCWLSA